MSPPAPRKSVTRTACVPCRESKIKCNKVAPICGCCAAKGRQCRFEEIDDKRRYILSHIRCPIQYRD
ncbi:unnamed protein product [Clonostachys chloroleuca]|uniref:Zn(2)-C6 fungal-type domain-containing protein n=1 Tax=Clonostachys chloroleuca TaxID=1926264 RepID=A0AA35Q475_9HYPO|nr:unnamed protein product [Clonostachys chloroleuca]